MAPKRAFAWAEKTLYYIEEARTGLKACCAAARLLHKLSYFKQNKWINIEGFSDKAPR